MNDPGLLKRVEASLPPEFDEELYRRQHRDLQRMSADQLHTHWLNHGLREGRRPHALEDNHAFLALIPPSARRLEIAQTAGVLTTDPNVARIDLVGLDAPVNALRSTNGGATYDIVVARYVVERCPDLIRHLQAVEQLLRVGGFYFLMISDRRFGADYFVPSSTIADVIGANFESLAAHSLRSRLEHAALSTHDDPVRHWRGDHGLVEHMDVRLQEELRRHRNRSAAPIDVNAWHFDPNNFREIVTLLFELQYTNMCMLRVYPTIRHTNEFWAVLKRRS